MPLKCGYQRLRKALLWNDSKLQAALGDLLVSRASRGHACSRQRVVGSRQQAADTRARLPLPPILSFQQRLIALPPLARSLPSAPKTLVTQIGFLNI